MSKSDAISSIYFKGESRSRRRKNDFSTPVFVQHCLPYRTLGTARESLSGEKGFERDSTLRAGTVVGPGRRNAPRLVERLKKHVRQTTGPGATDAAVKA